MTVAIVRLISILVAVLIGVALIALLVQRRRHPLPLARALRGNRIVTGPFRSPVSRRLS